MYEQNCQVRQEYIDSRFGVLENGNVPASRFEKKVEHLARVVARQVPFWSEQQTAEYYERLARLRQYQGV